jgi:hypothetical protein
MALYAFLVLDVVANYGASMVRISPLIILGLVFLAIFKSPLLKGNASDTSTTPKYFHRGLIALIVLFTAISAFLPGFNERHPRGQNIIYLQDTDAQTAKWVSNGIGGQDQAFLDAAGFDIANTIKIPHGLTFGHKVAKPTPFKNLPPVQHTLVQNSVTDGVRTVIMDVTSSHQGYELGIAFERGFAPDTVSVNGQPTADYTQKKYWNQLTIRGPKADTFRVEFVGNAEKFASLTLIDTYSLLPEDTEGMAALRPKNSAPIHAGDRAHILKKVSLQ